MPAAFVEEPSFLVDYDVACWVRVPRDPASVDVRKWAASAAEAWARDTHHEGDRKWTKLLARMLERGPSARFAEEPDAVFLHLLAPPSGPPSPLMVTLRFLPVVGDLDTIASDLVQVFSAGAVEPPTEEPVTLSSGAPARVVTSHQREDDGSILTNLNVLWVPTEGLCATVGSGTYDIGRLVVARDDMMALAGSTRVLRPGDEVPAGQTPGRDGEGAR